MEELKENKKEVFTVPKGYFKQLNRNIMAATVDTGTASPRHKHFVLGKFTRIAGYAAAIILLLGVLFFPENKTDDKAIVTVVASENTDIDSEYIDNIFNSYNIDEYTFYCYLTNTDF